MTEHIDKEGKLQRFTDHPLDMDKVEVHRCLEWLKAEVCHTDQSWNAYVAVIRTVYKWKFEREGGEGFPDSVRRIKLRKVRKEDQVRRKILSEREVRNLIEAGDCPRDKALVAVCWEGGFRIGELLSMTIGGCEKMSYGFDVTVTGKTGTRCIPIVLSAPLLEMWLYCHPNRDNRESPLWVKKRGNRIVAFGYSGADKTLKLLCRRSGLKRHVHWHMLRHTRATEYARRQFGDSSMRKVFGWTDASQMAAIYTHLVPGDTKDTVLAMSGVKKVERVVSDQILEPKTCFKCGERNPFDALFCVKCSLPLSREGAEKMLQKEKVLELLSTPGLFEKFQKYLESLRDGKE